MVFPRRVIKINTCCCDPPKNKLILPPHYYADGLKQHMIETRVKKKIGTRGPYDTFTGHKNKI